MVLFRRLGSALLLIITCSVLLFGYSAPGHTQEHEREKRRVAQVLSTAGYRKMAEARELLEADDQSSGIALLQEVIDGSRYSEYDQAKALQIRAFVYVSDNQYAQAIEMYTRALDLQVLDLGSELELIYSLANLYAYTEQYQQSIAFLEKWFAATDNPDAQAHFTAAQVYALSEEPTTALYYAERGLTLHQNDPEAEPRESWYRLLLAIRLQLKKYSEGSELLEQMIELWPNKTEYYTQLSALYGELGRELDALLVMAIAHRTGLLSEGTSKERLARMYRYHDYPHKGAGILQAMIDQDESADDGQEWKALGDAYSQAREWESAKTAYLQGARLSSTGEDWLRICQTASRDGLWNEAREYCQNAIDKGGLEEDHNYAWQILALAHYHGDDRHAAMEAFAQCSEPPEADNTCTEWLSHVEKQIEQEKLEDERQLREQQQAAQRKDSVEDAVESALYFHR
ncbi:MAG: hypothetical protein WDZ30_10600 [Cellvibrionaceae bacterium]